MINLLPPYERQSKVFREIIKSNEIQFDKLGFHIKDLEKQLNIDTATWGLEIYEKELGIRADLNKSLDDRRSVIKSKWRGTGKVDRMLIKIVVDAYTNGSVDVIFDGQIYVIFNDIRGRPSNIEDVYRILEDIIPAHLNIVYEFVYIVWKELAGYTWNNLKNFTWDELKTGGDIN